MKEEKWTPPSNASVTEQSLTPPSDAISVDEKKNSTPTSQSGSQDLSAPVRQDGVPSSENTEPIDLPTSYQSDRSNYKDLVSGGRYKLLRGGKPIIGTWDAEKQQFIKEPLLDYSVKPKQQGIIESVLPYPLNIPKPESEENVLGRVATDVDNIQKEAADKFVAAQYLSSFQPIQQLQTLEEAYKNNPTKQLRQSIDTLKSRKLSDTDFEGVRFEGDKNVYQGILPAPRVGEQLVPFEGELPKLPKTDMTVGEAYNELQDNKSYIEQAVNEVQGFNSFVNRELVKKLPEDKQQYLSSLSDTPLYQEELIKSLEQSNQSDNVVIAYLKGVEHSLNGIYQAGSTIGLDENQVYEKMLTEYNKEKLFGYKPQTFGAEIANSLGSLTPDVAAGAINPALFIASFGSRMPEEQLKNYYFDKIDKGEKPDFNEAWKYATTSTALQGALLFGAGAVGGAGKQIIGETFGKRAGEILTETAKRAGKDAVAFGAGGTYLQNKINKAYEVTENSDYLKSMIDMGVIGAALGLVHLSPQALKSKISEKTKNEVTDMAAFMPSNYVNKLLKDGIDTGRITDSDANAIQERMTLVRRIAAELPKNLSLDEINELVPLYQTKDALLVKQKDASPTIKDVLKGQIADLDQKILVKAGIPLSAEENAERASLIKKEATREGDIDKLRLKHLNARHEAIQKSKEQAKANEIAEEAGVSGSALKDVVRQESDAEKLNKEAGVDIYVARQDIDTNGGKYTLSQIKENGNTNTFLIEDAKGNEVGKAQLSANGNYLENIRIDEKHRRKGLASKVYDFIELRKGIELEPSPNKQSKEAKALWDKRNLQKSVSNKANGGLLAKALGESMSKTFADFRNKQQVLLELENKYFEQKGLSKEEFNKLSENEKSEIIKDAIKWKNDNPELVKSVEDLIGKAPTQYTEAATLPKKESGGVSGSALKDVPTSLRGVKYSDIVVGDKHLEDILDENKLSDAEKNQVREIFSRGVDYFKFDKEGEQKFQEKFSNPEDITDVADIMTGVSAAQQSAFDFHNTKNYDNVKDAVNYIASNPNDYSPKVVKAVKEIKEKLDNPSSSMSRLYAIDVMKELGIKASEQVTEIAPKEEAKDYQVTTEPTKMLDGEDGVRVTITKPNGEKVELGEMYPEDVDAEVAKKIRGFKLADSKNKPTEQSPVEQETPKQDLTGKEVSFSHAGSEKTGTVQSVDKDGNLKVRSKDGVNYTVKPTDAKVLLSSKSGTELISEGWNDIKEALTTPTGTLTLNPKLVTGFAKIGYGLIKEGQATAKNVIEKIKKYIKENGGWGDVKEKDFNESAKEIEEKIKELNQKSFLETMKDSPATSEEMKVAVAELDQFYEVLHNKEALAEADKKIAEDLGAAKEFVLSNSTPSAEKSAMAVRLIKHYEKAKDYDSAIELVNAYDNQLREAGRFVQAASLWNKLSPETVLRTANREAEKAGQKLSPEVQKEILKRMGEVDKMPEGAERDKATLEVLNYIAEQLPYSIGDWLDAYRYQNMLSNPRSHERNIYGNLFNVFLTEPASLAMKSGYDILANMNNPAARDAKIGQVPKYFQDALMNIPNAFMAAKETYSNGYAADKILDIGNTVSQIEALRRTKLPKYLTVATRFLEAQDRFFSVLIGQGEKMRLMRNGVSEADATAKATKLAEEYLYREKMDASDKSKPVFVRSLDALGKGINDMRRLPVIGKPFSWFVPFVTTPINVAKMGVKFSPLGFVGGKEMYSSPNARTHISNAALGTIATGVGATLAMQGLTSWSAPRDKKERELFYASGRKPYSVKVGDKWVPMAYFGPFALSLALPASVKHYQEDTKTALTDSDMEQVKDAILSTSGFVTSQTPLSSTDGFFKAIGGDEDYTVDKVLGYVSSQAIPLAGMIRYINTILDPVYRKSKGYVESVESGIPELSKELEPIKTPDGKEAEREPTNALVPYDLGFSDKDYEIMLKTRRELQQERELARKKNEEGGVKKLEKAPKMEKLPKMEKMK